MILLNFDNAFLGAKIIKNGKEFYIYKINQKSFYYGETKYSVIRSQWENKNKDVTWKSLMSTSGAKMAEYEGFFLADEQEEKLKLKKLSDEKKEKKYLSPQAEKIIRHIYTERILKDKGNWRHQIEVGKEIFSIILAKKDGNLLLSIDDNFIFFNINNHKYIYWKPIGIPYKESSKEIPWPN